MTATTSTAHTPAPRPATFRPRPKARDAGPILLATDGQTSSGALFSAAGRLAERWSAAVRVLTVVEPLPALATPFGPDVVPPPLELEQERQAAQRAFVRRRLEAAVGRRDDWSLEVVGGSPARTIADVARRGRARLVVMERHPHSRLGRLIGADTVARVLASSDRPVLAVAPALDGPPRRAVVGVDFSAASLRAVELALSVLAPPASLTLVCVRPRIEIPHALGDAFEASYASRAAQSFDRLVRRLAVPAGVELHTATVAGRAADELVAFAVRTGADLLAFGRHGYGAVERFLLGSVAAELLHHAPCSVLVTPEPPPAEAVALRCALLGDAETDRPGAWAALVDDFSRRNAGRLTRLAVGDGVGGERELAHGHALLGAAYDPHDGRVELMLGDAPDGRRRLAHAVDGVTAVAVLAEADGTDWGLRIASGGAQTLLTFE